MTDVNKLENKKRRGIKTRQKRSASATIPVASRNISHVLHTINPEEKHRSRFRNLKQTKQNVPVLANNHLNQGINAAIQPSETVPYTEITTAYQPKRLPSITHSLRRSRQTSMHNPLLSDFNVQIYDVHRSGQEAVLNETLVPAVECTTINDRRSRSECYLNESPYSSYIVPKTYSNLRSQPKNQNVIRYYPETTKNTLSTCTENNLLYENKKNSLMHRMLEQRLLSKYTDKTDQTIQPYKGHVELIYPSPTIQVNASNYNQTSPYGSVVKRNANQLPPMYPPDVLRQARSLSDLPLEICRIGDVNYSTTIFPQRPKSIDDQQLPNSIQRVSLPESAVISLQSKDVFPTLHDNSVHNSPTAIGTDDRSLIYYQPSLRKFSSQLTLPMSKGIMHSKPESTFEGHKFSSQSHVSMWSETHACRTGSEAVGSYELDPNPVYNESKNSKNSQVGRPMLFSDLESDSNSSESNTQVYKVTSPEPIVKSSLKRTKLTAIPQRMGSINTHIKPNEVNFQSYNTNSVTLLNPTNPDGPKLSSEGPVFLYATRKNHEDKLPNNDR